MVTHQSPAPGYAGWDRMVVGLFEIDYYESD